MKIAIANDDPIATDLLEYIVTSTPEHEVIWAAVDGAQAVSLALDNTPDLILMDIYMPVLDGVETTRKIMLQSPCAILIVTSSIDDHSGKVFDAMGAGAVDAVNTPVLVGSTEKNGAKTLLDKIAIIGILTDSSIGHRHTRYEQLGQQEKQHDTHLKNVIVIGASTGGPNALAMVLSKLPKNFSVPIVIVQHVDSQFVQGLVDWLTSQTSLTVSLAVHGDKLKSGVVYIAGTDQHIIINKSGVIEYQEEPSHYIHKPSVNVLFESVALNWKGQAVAVLLTGMGKDGAAGLLAMRDQGFSTIAQDEQSCAVYGMPKTAVELDAAQAVLPLADIGMALCEYFNFNKKSKALINE